MKPLERITQRVNRHGDVNDPATPRPLLTLAEFFEGNDVDWQHRLQPESHACPGGVSCAA